jgi:hypothetical protein
MQVRNSRRDVIRWNNYPRNPRGAATLAEMGGSLRCAGALLASWLCAAPMMAAADASSSDEGRDSGQSSLLDALSSPEFDISDAFRIHSETLVVPDAAIGSGHTSLVRPELGVRATWPVNERIVLRVMTRAAVSRYEFSGDVWGPTSIPSLGVGIPNSDPLIGDSLDLYSARLAFEGAYRLSDRTGWFADNEQWGVVGASNVGSRWEDSAFHAGASAGFAVGFGYEIPEVLRVALGVSLQTPLDRAAFDASPFVSLRWRPLSRVTVRSRELGAQVEFDVLPSLEAYVTGFRSSDRFQLRDRIGVLDELSFRDRYIRAGVGFNWKPTGWLRVGLEGGALVDRVLRVKDEDLGTLLSRRPDPSGYVSIRIEFRL